MLSVASLTTVAFNAGAELTRPAAASRPVVMMADAAKNPFGRGKTLPPIPKGPFGDFVLPGDSSDGWVGDQSKGTQIDKFQSGEDYLFFQGPAPKTAIQEDLPDFFSLENFEDIEIVPAQIAVTATGLLSFAVVLGTLLGDATLPVPSLPSVSFSLPAPPPKKTLSEEALAAEAAAKAEKEAAKAAKAEAEAAVKAEKLAAKEAREAEKAAEKALKAEAAATKKGEAAEAKAAEEAATAEVKAAEAEAKEKAAAKAEAKAEKKELFEEEAADLKAKAAAEAEAKLAKSKK